MFFFSLANKLKEKKNERQNRNPKYHHMETYFRKVLTP